MPGLIRSSDDARAPGAGESGLPIRMVCLPLRVVHAPGSFSRGRSITRVAARNVDLGSDRDALPRGCVQHAGRDAPAPLREASLQAGGVAPDADASNYGLRNGFVFSFHWTLLAVRRGLRARPSFVTMLAIVLSASIWAPDTRTTIAFAISAVRWRMDRSAYFRAQCDLFSFFPAWLAVVATRVAHRAEDSRILSCSLFFSGALGSGWCLRCGSLFYPPAEIFLGISTRDTRARALPRHCCPPSPGATA
jgi:hypothetical protein